MVLKVKRRYHPSQTSKRIQKIAKALNVPRDTVGGIVCKFKVKGTVVTLQGR